MTTNWGIAGWTGLALVGLGLFFEIPFFFGSGQSWIGGWIGVGLGAFLLLIDRLKEKPLYLLGILFVVIATVAILWCLS